MNTMQAAVLYGPEDVRIEEVPIREPAEGEVRVRIQAALTCGTDVKVYRRGYHARMIQPPALFGHEFAGVIEAIGPNVQGWQIGQRVVAANSAPCGRCLFCRRGQSELCRELLFLNGAYAETILVPARIVATNLLPIPPHLDFAEAALVEPLACVVHGLARLSIHPGESVAVIGLGPVGLLFVRLCVLAGARVLAIGRRAQRLTLAKALGADKVFDLQMGEEVLQHLKRSTDEGLGADWVIEAVGTTQAWEHAIALARPGGTVCLFGGCPAGSSIALDTHRIHYEEVTLISAFHHTPSAVRQALTLLSEGKIPTHLFLQHRATLSQIPDVLACLANGTLDAIKVAVTPA
ncbi:theronine dehydrogenase-like Zn-dependent dehydrogenase [Chthonomonas calidirosea]|uniref:Threonine dehydrogenase and related Zn-dependent dehydrogenases n=1 Tax=Chthonomonas calidirosea (strain DSM 23976 / ICMP 18418 / T49) TaxID=1303518 RepID=S0ESP6_CHTCT|nr:alcohol dehydrogenase catalytic domain-containing protein [Chthonomonas calidirosea]CCW33970.1 Threonine dehydrogenase and related Zn-dependent dehydrogenases [Chthonomonas calidirosea T49]CEK15017.1 theronine dehydrogenase-like Zn-dependent dehydrogenase [Chthonomonas calidirosea]CEK15018.1 theronine dehydrogenase-like Zn-dependent dehydrogenase [Chthonomonas calidirosea]CEK16138.1 theronine dehydrogenase-like Zn-dependent dehydrogenase [Chthonomonas calidirosea]